jgi:uncharacterized protein
VERKGPRDVTAPVSDEQIRVPVLATGWHTVTFVHWPVESAAVQAVLPPGLTVDPYDGRAWLTLVPLRMSGVALPGLAAGPRLSFNQTNLRTYVRAPNGRVGIHVLKIEATSALMTRAARIATGARYRLGDLSIVEHDERISYGGALRDGSGSYRLDVAPGERMLAPSDRDVWFTGRWRAYTWHLGRLLETPVAHEPWPLSKATVQRLHETLADSVGLPGPGPDPLVHFSEGVGQVRVGLPRPLSGVRRRGASRTA